MRPALRIFLVWLAVWPLVMVGLAVLRAIGPEWPMPLRTLVLTGVLVPLISLGIAPLVAWLLDRSTGNNAKSPASPGSFDR